jgi:putative transposase
MPEHVHLLIGEPERGDPSVVMQVLKQRVARKVLRLGRQRRRTSANFCLWAENNGNPDPFWQVRFYDFVVWSKKKRVEKLRYMHRNPVKRGLVLEPEQWAWSSYRYYALGERGIVLVNETQPAVIKIRDRRNSSALAINENGISIPTLRKPRRVGQPRIKVD